MGISESVMQCYLYAYCMLCVIPPPHLIQIILQTIFGCSEYYLCIIVTGTQLNKCHTNGYLVLEDWTLQRSTYCCLYSSLFVFFFFFLAIIQAVISERHKLTHKPTTCKNGPWFKWVQHFGQDLLLSIRH